MDSDDHDLLSVHCDDLRDARDEGLVTVLLLRMITRELTSTVTTASQDLSSCREGHRQNA